MIFLKYVTLNYINKFKEMSKENENNNIIVPNSPSKRIVFLKINLRLSSSF